MDFRQYDPSTGRFYAIDLLAEATYNKTPYHFAGNNPVIGSDPTGLLTFFNGKDHSQPQALQGGQNGYGMINWFGNTPGTFLENVHNGYGLDPLNGGGMSGGGGNSGGRFTPYGLGTGYSGGFRAHMGFGNGGEWLYVRTGNVVSSVSGNNTEEGNDAIIKTDKEGYFSWFPTSNDFFDSLSDFWNSPIARSIVSDKFSLTLSTSVTAIFGVSEELSFTWITRGHDANIVPYVMTSSGGQVGFGVSGDALIGFSTGIFAAPDLRSLNAGDVRNGLRGWSIYGSLDAGEVIGGSITGSVGFSDKPIISRPTWFTLGISAGASIGAGGTVGASYSFPVFESQFKK